MDNELTVAPEELQMFDVNCMRPCLMGELPKFELKEGNELFLPKPKHYGDAGADIRLWTDQVIDEAEAQRRFRQGRLLGYTLYVNGKVVKGTEPTSRGVQVDNANGLYDAIIAADPQARAVQVQHGAITLCHAGFKIALPDTMYGDMHWVYKIVPRSGLAVKHGITVVNSPGIIDKGYRNWVHVALECLHTQAIHYFTYGSRIAQGLMEMVADQNWDNYGESVVVPSLDDSTERGVGGFGSTGVE